MRADSPETSAARGVFLLWLAACGQSAKSGGVGGGGGASHGETSSSSSGSSASSAASSGASSSGASSSGAMGNCPGTLSAGDSNETIMSGGRSRSFIVHIPTGYNGSSPVPVVFDFHPLGGSGAQQEGSTGWKQKGDTSGFITVFPTGTAGGIGNSWNVGRCCGNAQMEQVDDVQFTRDVIMWLEAHTCVDPKRIYASGGSNGGGMAYMLACQAADVIAAVAPVDFDCITAPGGPTAMPTCACTLPRPISVTQFRATGDQAVPYNGGMTPVPADCPPGGNCGTFDFPGAMTNFQTCEQFDLCTGAATTNPINSHCQTYPTCGAGTEVTLCTWQGGSHLGQYQTLDIVNTAWQMFQKESLP
jgi:polyhydroxybutyrate depolymerase